ncbi:hypothetical protein [Desulfotignum phosphitoxidans]|uniref:HEPN domain-containing protein n=1 Tax=Desulfotignum phosphitoxidans DSM 13687 TaxID=1286635 RepID=S0G568_9BACT|nr:hypothetical protein [Desulfotignum phosphitoxidans]EMS79196.1 hypothetical protein Dpo_5c01190 [Desulfotignum phosphitoxidans DSM 13687]
MAFNWEHFLTVADYLRNNCGNITQIDREAAFRTAISRAYYAAYNTARDYAENNLGGIRSSGSGSHDNLISTFIHFKDDNQSYGTIALNLGRVKVHRVDADYKQRFKNNQKPSYVAHLAVNFSDIIIKEIKHLESARESTIYSKTVVNKLYSDNSNK